MVSSSLALSTPYDSIRFDLLSILTCLEPCPVRLPPCGLAPTPGIPLVAQAVQHRELLHVHASLAHIHTILPQPLALRSPPLLDRVTHPHLRAQLQGLDNTLLLALRVNHTAIHYTHELLTALGLLHILHHSPEQLEAELQGRTDFADSLPLSTTSTITTVHGITVFEGQPHHSFPPDVPPMSTSPSTTRTHNTFVRAPPSSGPPPPSEVPRTLLIARSRSRSRPRSTTS